MVQLCHFVHFWRLRARVTVQSNLTLSWMILVSSINLHRPNSRSGNILDGYNLYLGCLLRSWAISVIPRPALLLPVSGVPWRPGGHIHGWSLSVVLSVLSVHLRTPLRLGDKDVCYYSQCHSGRNN